MGTIRFLLALSVLMIHSGPIFGVTLVPGYLAVRSFYIISGFLMALVITEKYQYTDRPYYYFISNRLLRIYPLYITVIILTLLLSLGLGITLGSYGKIQYYINQYRTVPQSLGSLCIIFLTNLTMIGQDIICFLKIDNTSGHLVFTGLQSGISLQELLLIPIAWTVAVEFIFYLLAPFIVGKNKKLPLVLIVIILALTAGIFFSSGGTGNFFIYKFAPTEVFWFLLGAIAYHLYKEGRHLPDSTAPVLFAFIIVLMAAYQFIPGNITDTIFFALIFLGCPVLFKRYAKSKTDKYLGDLCYPIYISHCMILLIVSANRFPKIFGMGLPTLLMTLLFSVLSNKFILEPFEKYRRNRIQKNQASEKAVLAMQQ